MSSDTEGLRVAAVQMCARLGEIEANCAAAERLAGEAFAEGARWVILPEFFTSAMAFHPSLLFSARPADGEPFALLRRLARENDGVVGGSFIALRREPPWPPANGDVRPDRPKVDASSGSASR